MTATNDVRPRSALRAFAVALLALAGTAAAQTPPYQINAFGSPTTTTIVEGQTFTPVVRVTDGAGVPVEGWSVDWTVAPSGSITTPTTTSTSGFATLGGVSSNSFSNFVAGTYTISASTFDGIVIILKDGTRVRPAGTTAPVTFTVNVENVGLAITDPAGGKDVIKTNAIRALGVYWGSASLPQPGTTINWSIVSEPSAGAGTLGTPTTTDGSGISTVDFSGAVAGDYTVQAAEFGCTWCAPTTQQFIITVVDPQVDVHVIASGSPDPVAPDGTITYTLGAGNNGPDPATATLTDALPANTVFQSLSSAAGWSCAIPAVGASGTVTCTHPALASGAADLFSLVVAVSGYPAAGTTITNTASISAVEADTDPTNDNATATTTVAGVDGLAVAKTFDGYTDTDGSTTVSVGDTLAYTVTATNTGNTGLTSVLVQDDHFPATQACAALSPGGTCVLSGGYVVTAADEQAGQVVNTGSAASLEVPVPVTDTVTTPVVLIPAPALDLQNVQSGWDDNDATGDVSPGDLLTYTVTATNTGNVPLTNVALSDDRFAGTQACASVPVGGTCVLTGTDLMDNNDVPQVDNTATATALELGAPVTATATTPVVFHPFPAMTATYVMASYDDADGNAQVTQGDTLHVLVTATNTGNTTLTNLQVDDPQLVPTFEVCSGVSPGGTCQLVATTVVTQGDAIFGSVDRTANVAATELPSWGTVAFSTPATATPAVVVDNVLTATVDQDGSGDVSVGDELDYDITATNTGSLTLTNVTVASNLYGGTQTCAAVAPNGTCVLNVIYVVQPADATAGRVTNTGSVTSVELPTPAADAEVTAVAPAPPALTIVSGDGSAGYGGQSATLVVQLLDAAGAPMAGATITWTGASLATCTTGSDGRCSNTVSFNGTSGFFTVNAAYLPAGVSVDFNLQSVSAALAVASGDNQAGPANGSPAQPLVVFATDDGNPASVPIHWSVVSGDATVAPTDTTSGADGLASTVVTFGPGTGPVQVQAQRTDAGETAVFTVTAAARTLVKVSGDNQNAATGTAFAAPLVVQANLGATPEAGVDITWTTASSTISLVPTSPTDGAGRGSAQVTCGAVAETFTVTAALTSDPTQAVTFSGTCTLTRTLLVHDGNNQVGPPGATLPLNLVVEAQDNGLGADGVVIRFSVIGGSDAQVGTCCATTAGGGFAGTSLTLRSTPGPVQVRAERADDPSVFVVFDATAQSRGLVAVSGDNQSAPVGAALAAPLTVLSTLGGAPEGNITIDWTSTATAASLTPVVNPTDANGLGAAQVTCGATAETFIVTAARIDDPSLTVSFTATCTLTRALVITGGNNQSGGIGTAAAQPLQVQALDNGAGVDGVTINYSLVQGDATFATSVATAGGGFAGNTLTFGATPGAVQVRAERADDPTVFVVFDATAVQPVLTLVSGTAQSGYPAQPGSAPLVVELRDGTAANAPIAGATIHWSTISGDAVPDAATSLTGADGRASMTFTFGTSGDSFLQATDGGSAAVDFGVHAIDARLLVISGNGDSLAPGNQFDLVVRAVDDLTSSGTTVSWAVVSGGATVLTPNTTVDNWGQTSATVSADSVGPVVVTATRDDQPGVTATFNLNVVPPPTFAIVSGDGQSGLAATVADAPMVVRLLDGSGNPIAGQDIDWTITGPGTLSAIGATTDANGRAQAQLTYGPGAGAITVNASVVAQRSLAVAFAATSLDAAIGIGSGDNQSGPVGTTLPIPLTVVVGAPTNAPGKGGVRAQALDGVPVTFAVASGGGSVAPTVVLTDATGHASTMFILGPVEGAQSVTASVPGGASVTFNATATVNRTQVIVSGNGQAGAPGTALAAPLVVHAQDNGGDVAGVGINWTVPSGSATLAPSGATDASGVASATATLGATGAVTIRATRADDATVFVDFSASTAQIQALVGLTPEEHEIAVVIDETCATLAGMASLTPEQQDFLARCQDLTGGSITDPGGVIDALEQLIPDFHIAMQEAAFNAAQSQFQNLKARIAALRSGTQGSSFQGLAFQGPNGSVSLGALGKALTADAEDAAPTGEVGTGFQRWGFFASGTIGRGEAEDGRARPAYDYDINGLTVGLDYRYSDRFIFGGALGYTRQDAELRGAPGNMDMSGWSVSGYATWYHDDSWYMDGVLTWGRNSFDLLRRITYTVGLPGGGSSTIDQTARSDSDGDLLEGAFTFGRDFQAGGWSIGPYGRVLYTKLDFDRIVDEMDAGPGSGLGLEVDARTLTSVASELGAKFTYAHSTDWGVVTPHLQVEWEHEFKDDPKALTARFLADPDGTPFSLSGEAIDKDYFKLSVGLSLILQHGRSGFVIYERTVGRDGFFQDNLGLGVRIEF
jgi:uncharacterized repeat protein (TIGR01451 family)